MKQTSNTAPNMARQWNRELHNSEQKIKRIEASRAREAKRAEKAIQAIHKKAAVAEKAVKAAYNKLNKGFTAEINNLIQRQAILIGRLSNK